VLGYGEYIYTHLDGTQSISKLWCLSLSPGSGGGFLGRVGVQSRGGIPGSGGILGIGGWHSGWRCRQLWVMPVGLYVPAEGLQSACDAILARKAAILMIDLHHCQMAFDSSLLLLMPRTLNCSLRPFLHLGAKFLDYLMGYMYWGVRKHSVGHFGHIQG
jgi:hypothetical protein